VRVVVRTPSPALAPFVESIWYYETPDLTHARERVLPSGKMQLLVNLDEDELRWWDGARFDRKHRLIGAAFMGPHAEPFAIDTAEQRRVMGVTFRAGGAFPFIGPPASALTGDHVALDALWGRDGATLRERALDTRDPEEKLAVLERALLSRTSKPLERDPMIARAAAALEEGLPIAALVAQLGSSEKRFVRRFVEQVGLNPKRFARVRRFQQLLRSIACGRSVPWARVASECGYYDQSHLVHEFRAFSGMAPSEYRARDPHDWNHVPISD
jgi:AraC-like DNA-binding protein